MFGGKTDIQKNVHVLLTTIHQLKKLIVKKQIDLKNLKVLVMDEVDSVVGNDFGKNTAKLLFNKYIKECNYKFILTSATITEDFKEVVESIPSTNNYAKIELKVEQLTLKNVYQFNIKYSDISQKD